MHSHRSELEKVTILYPHKPPRIGRILYYSRKNRHEEKTMNKLTKGAIAMVLMGSVTFSITNALFADHSSKRIAEANAAIRSGDQKKADHKDLSSKRLAEANTLSNFGNQKTADDINQADKSVQDQTPTTDVKDLQTTASHKIAAVHEVLKNGSNSGIAVAAIGKSSTANSDRTTTVKTTAPATNTKTNSNSTATETTSTNSANAPTTTTTAPGQSKKTTGTPGKTASTTAANNHGKQVSQAAKEKAASHQDKKGNKRNKKVNL